MISRVGGIEVVGAVGVDHQTGWAGANYGVDKGIAVRIRIGDAVGPEIAANLRVFEAGIDIIIGNGIMIDADEIVRADGSLDPYADVRAVNTVGIGINEAEARVQAGPDHDPDVIGCRTAAVSQLVSVGCAGERNRAEIDLVALAGGEVPNRVAGDRGPYTACGRRVGHRDILESIATLVAVKPVRAVVALDPIRAVAAVDFVVAGAALEVVGAIVLGIDVAEGIAPDDVPELAADNGVVAVAARHLPTARGNHGCRAILERAEVDRVYAVAAGDSLQTGIINDADAVGSFRSHNLYPVRASRSSRA